MKVVGRGTVTPATGGWACPPGDSEDQTVLLHADPQSKRQCWVRFTVHTGFPGQHLVTYDHLWGEVDSSTKP